MESNYLDTNVTALLTYPTDNITKTDEVDEKLRGAFLEENPFVLLAGIESQLEIFLPYINVSTKSISLRR